MVRGSYSGPHSYYKLSKYQTGNRYNCLFYHSENEDIENKRYELRDKCNALLEKCDKLREKANLRWHKKCNAYDVEAETLWENSNKLINESKRLWQEGLADTKG